MDTMKVEQFVAHQIFELCDLDAQRVLTIDSTFVLGLADVQHPHLPPILTDDEETVPVILLCIFEELHHLLSFVGWSD